MGYILYMHVHVYLTLKVELFCFILVNQTHLQVNHHSSADWTKYDERLIECVESGDLEKLR